MGLAIILPAAAVMLFTFLIKNMKGRLFPHKSASKSIKLCPFNTYNY